MNFSFSAIGTKKGVVKELSSDNLSYASNEHARACRDMAISVVEEIHDKVTFVKVEASGHHSTANEHNPGYGNIGLKISWNGHTPYHADPAEDIAVHD